MDIASDCSLLWLRRRLRGCAWGSSRHGGAGTRAVVAAVERAAAEAELDHARCRNAELEGQAWLGATREWLTERSVTGPV